MQTSIYDFLQQTFYGNDLYHWFGALVIIVLGFPILLFLRKIILNRLGKITRNTHTLWDDWFLNSLNRTKTWFLLIITIAIGLSLLKLPSNIDNVIYRVTVIVFLIQAGLWISAIFTASLDNYRHRQKEKDPASITTLNAIGFVGKFILWSALLLLALQNLGINVTTLIAGLGVGGVAIALAVQNILGDLFAALSILLDKPFAVGDFLIVDDYMGAVENIGLKSTRIRSLSGEELVFSNSDLLKSRLRNYGRMFERRVVFSLGVTYQTPLDKLKLIPSIIKTAITAQDKTRFDRSHFQKYGDFSLLYESVYYVLSSDYNIYMDIQQAINFQIHERFSEENIEFAYPTQTLFVTTQQSPPPSA